jgi:Protein of unknown function (DUF4031)
VTVYVDKFPSGWGKWSGGGHMLTSDLDELHAMADRIGLKRSWFQGDKTFAHYDVQARKRALAVSAGAVEIEWGEIPDDVLVRNDDGTYETRAARLDRLRTS